MCLCVCRASVSWPRRSPRLIVMILSDSSRLWTWCRVAVAPPAFPPPPDAVRASVPALRGGASLCAAPVDGCHAVRRHAGVGGRRTWSTQWATTAAACSWRDCNTLASSTASACWRRVCVCACVAAGGAGRGGNGDRDAVRVGAHPLHDARSGSAGTPAQRTVLTLRCASCVGPPRHRTRLA